MKNLKTLTLILFAASTLFAISCKDTTDDPTTNQTSSQKDQIIGSWSLTKFNITVYDSTTNESFGGFDFPQAETWTFNQTTLNGAVEGESFTATWDIKTKNKLALVEDGESWDLEISTLTSTNLQLKDIYYEDGERSEVTYYFTKK